MLALVPAERYPQAWIVAVGNRPFPHLVRHVHVVKGVEPFTSLGRVRWVKYFSRTFEIGAGPCTPVPALLPFSSIIGRPA